MKPSSIKPDTGNLRVLFLAPAAKRGKVVTDIYSIGNTLAFNYLRGYTLGRLGKDGPVEFFIEEYEDVESVRRFVETIAPHVVGFSCYLDTVEGNMEAAGIAREAAPGACIVAGGPETIFSERFLDRHPVFDIAVRGEAESYFLAFIECILQGKDDFSDVPSISWRDGDRIVTTPDAPPVQNLDEIPSVYGDEMIPDLKGIVLHETSRGCRYRCRFCTWTSKLRRFYSMERIEADLKRLLSQPNIKRIYIYDPDFSEDAERAKSILNIIKKNDVHGIEFSCFMTFGELDEELLEMLRELDFPTELPFGLQTTNTEALRVCGRKWFDFDAFDRNLSVIFEYIPIDKFVIDLLYGLPADDYAGLRNSIRWCLEKGFSRLNFFRMSGLQGTEFAENADKYGLVFQPDTPYHVIRSDTFTEEDLAKAEKLIENYQVFSAFIGMEEYKELKKLGVDWLDVLETIDECTPDWKSFFVRAGKDNIGGVNSGVLLPALDYIKEKYPREVFSCLYGRWRTWLIS